MHLSVYNACITNWSLALDLQLTPWLWPWNSAYTVTMTVQEAYLDYFRHIDESMGIYMHRWGDAPIHLLAVSLLLVSACMHVCYAYIHIYMADSSWVPLSLTHMFLFILDLLILFVYMICYYGVHIALWAPTFVWRIAGWRGVRVIWWCRVLAPVLRQHASGAQTCLENTWQRAVMLTISHISEWHVSCWYFTQSSQHTYTNTKKRTYMYRCIHTNTQPGKTHKNTDTNICMKHTCIYTHAWVHTYTCMHTYIRI